MGARERDALVFAVHDDDIGRRLDRVLRKLLPRASLDRIYMALRKGDVEVDGCTRDPAYRLIAGQSIRLVGGLAALAVAVPPIRSRRRFPESPAHHTIPVIYRNRHMVVFDKPRGIPVHGEQSLAEVMETDLKRWSQASLSFRPGPVHRLDRDTTGIVLFALSLVGAQELSTLLRDRACEKGYLALLEGEMSGTEEWRDNLKRDPVARRSVADPAGQAAETHVVPLGVAGGCTLAEVRIVTGRTHQIRAQASLHGHPLLGDTRYGGRAEPAGYVLHCARFVLPAATTVTERTRFESPLPALSLESLIAHLGRETVERALASIGGRDRGQQP